MNKYLVALVVATLLIIVTMISIDLSTYNVTTKSLITLMTNTRASVLTPSEHCERIKHTTKTLPTSEAPPWFNNNNATSTNRSRTVLYVWPTEGRRQRLGNRLFIYASTFGIAWRNGRVPIYPDTSNSTREYDLPRYFYLRIPTDKDNQIRTVR